MNRGDVLAVRRAAREKAEHLGFEAAALVEVETAVAELASNLVKHAAGGGEVILSASSGEGPAGLEIRVTDRGPGIADLEKALAGGHSTVGTLGIGLSGVKRLMDEFAIQTGPGTGTVITVRKWIKKQSGAILKFSVLATPFPGEQVSGDGYFIKHFPDYDLFGVIDALGHGSAAHAVTQGCLEILERHCREDLFEIVTKCHQGMRNTRGAAMALARVARGGRKLEHISVGNVDTRVYNSPRPARPFCFNGTLGMALEHGCRPQEYAIARGAIIVMCSDGIASRFGVPSELFGDSPQRIAESIFSGYVRGTDDATVLVGKVV